MYFRDQFRLVRKDIAREYGLVTVESKKEGRKLFRPLSAESRGGLSRSSAIVLRIQPHTLTLSICPTTSFQVLPSTRSWTIAFPLYVAQNVREFGCQEESLGAPTLRFQGEERTLKEPIPTAIRNTD